MKNIFTKTVLLAFSLVLMGCDFSKLNIDPNNITGDKLSLNQRLPSLEYFFGNYLASDVPKTISNTMGQVVYIQGNVGLNTYSYAAADPSKMAIWNNLFANVMYTADQIIQEADLKKIPYYRGIAKIIYAIGLAHATAIWGDVPYSQLFKNSEFPNPVFESQESIYGNIQKLLDQAIVDLSTPATGIVPLDDDFIFRGNTAKWIKTANALKARYYLHTIKVSNSSYDLAESALANALQSNDDNCLFKFQIGNPEQQNPLYSERVGTQNTQIDVAFTDNMRAKNDPRLPFYSTVRSSLVTGRRALYGPLYASRDSYIPIVTYEECMFMKAEIAMFKSGKAAAESDFRKAIKASLERVCTEKKWTADSGATALATIPITSSVLGTYIQAQGNLDSIATDEEVWKRLFEQKNIALFLQAEIWNDYRRATKYIAGVDGLPQITPRTGTAIPRRYNYPFNEVNYNKSTPTDPGIFSRVWWDR